MTGPDYEFDGTGPGDSVVLVRRELEAAYDQLQSTNEALATANDELRATIVELEQTNRELQAANDELEELTEELHATNDEIASISEELRRRSDEVDEVNAYLTAVLDALDAAVVVVDADLRVRTWNRAAQQRWSRNRTDVLGRSILQLDLGVAADRLSGPLRAAAGGGDGGPAIADGATTVCVRPLRTPNGHATGALLIAEDAVVQHQPAG